MAFICLKLKITLHLETFDSNGAVAAAAEEFNDWVTILGILVKERLKAFATTILLFKVMLFIFKRICVLRGLDLPVSLFITFHVSLILLEDFSNLCLKDKDFAV